MVALAATEERIVGKRNRRKTSWLAATAFATADTVLAANTLGQTTILAGNTLSAEEVTLARILGDFKIQNTSGAESITYIGVCLEDSRLPVANSKNPRTEADDEDWLWWRAFALPSGGTVGPGNVYGAGGGVGGLGIDIRARRRWPVLDRDLRFKIISNGAVDYFQACRVLVYLP